MIKLATTVFALVLAPALALGAGKSEGPWKVETSALGTTVTNGTTAFARRTPRPASRWPTS